MEPRPDPRGFRRRPTPTTTRGRPRPALLANRDLSPAPPSDPGPLGFLCDRSDLGERWTEAMVAIPQERPELALATALATAGAVAAFERGAVADLRPLFLAIMAAWGEPPRRPWSRR